MANIKKHDYKALVESLRLKFLSEHKKFCVVEDEFGFKHKMHNSCIVKGVPTGVRSVFDKSEVNSYYLKIISNRHKDIFSKSSFEKFNYEKALSYTTATCLKHGDYRTKPNWLMTRGHHCEQCSEDGRSDRVRIDTKEYIKRVKALHGDRYDYSKTVYKSAREPVTITCKEHGDFEIIAYYHSGDTCGCQVCGLENGAIGRGRHKALGIKSAKVYVAMIESDDEKFIKIGLSSKPESRVYDIQCYSEYKVTLIHTEFYEDAGVAWDVEKLLHKDFKEESYTPVNNFGGSTECFDVSIQDEVIKLLKTLS